MAKEFDIFVAKDINTGIVAAVYAPHQWNYHTGDLVVYEIPDEGECMGEIALISDYADYGDRNFTAAGRINAGGEPFKAVATYVKNPVTWPEPETEESDG